MYSVIHIHADGRRKVLHFGLRAEACQLFADVVRTLVLDRIGFTFYPDSQPEACILTVTGEAWHVVKGAV